MEVREVELGGVWNLGNYENLRLSIRVVVGPEGFGAALAGLTELLEKVSLLASVVRRASDRYRELLEKAKRVLEEAESYERRAVQALERSREEARKRLETVMPMLDPKVREVLEKQPEKAWELGILDGRCAYLENHNEYVEKAAEYRKKAEELREQAGQLLERLRTIRQLLRDGKVDKAHSLAAEIKDAVILRQEEWW